MTIGIDFGTSYSAVSWLNPETGKSEIIRDENGLEKVPSLVYLKDDGGVLVGVGAENLYDDASQMPNAERTAVLARMMRGTKRDLFPNRSIPLSDGSVVRPEFVVAEIIRYLKRTAEEQCVHDKIDSVVLTHPVAFTGSQCELLKKSAIDAGFKTVTLQPEPVAAAIGYLSSGAAVGKRVVVFDLGGGTLDLAYLENDAEGQCWTVLCQEGKADCGGNDFDQVLYDYVERKCVNEHGFGFSGESSCLNLQVLRETQKLKESLTNRETVAFRYFDENTCSVFACTIERVDFEKMSASMLDKISCAVDEFLSALERIGGHPDTVIMIGGASRIPCVSKIVRAKMSRFGIEPIATMHVDVAVALGASAMGRIVKQRAEKRLQDDEIPKEHSSVKYSAPGIEKVIETRMGEIYSSELADVFKAWY